MGLLTIGFGLLLTALFLVLTDSTYSFLCFVLGLIAGLILLNRAETRYNR